MRVVELFYSLQGEGLLAGVPSVFIRLAGCPLRCHWCDTPYAWDFETGAEYDVASLVARVRQFECQHVVITGGEPLVGPDLAVRPNLVELTQRLEDAGTHITIETAGPLFVPDLACDLMSISPKLSNANSGYSSTDPLTIASLAAAYDYQFKFVVESERDIASIQEMLEALGNIDRHRVMLMPQARTRAELIARGPIIAELCLRMGYAFSPRLHVMLWDNEKGK